ncbi:site-specific integrase [Streptomyces microflavus]|uniref:site-specific integrase n=1 Tax=Streptomyces microflavus TaxID=1919 RepID=UPI0033D1B63F
MSSSDEVPRDLQSICLARWGRVVPVDDVIPYVVEEPTGRPVDPIRRFLRDFVARGHSAGSVRSYAFDLHRWWRFLHVIEVPWDKVTSTEVRDFVLWMGQAKKQRRAPRTKSATTAGQVNPITRKQYLGDGYGARTIRHSNAVLRCFYEFIIDAGDRWSIRCAGTGADGGGRTFIATRWSRFGRRAGSATTPKCPGSGHGPCRMNAGSTSSRRCGPTGTGRS